MKPIVLPANQPSARFYDGGARIAAFRGDTTSKPNTPEDWVASVTTVRGESSTGLTILPGGGTFADAIASAPIDWLGDAHIAAFGADPNLLVKLLDAGQRLPVHAHPNDIFASDRLGATHGKAEAWYILTPGEIHLGLVETLLPQSLLRIVEDQDVPALLSRMHTLQVRAGDTVFVPPGVLHAIGEGILLVEVQQPEDLSILLEWAGFDLDGRRDGHLGLGFDLALDAVETTARTSRDIDRLMRRAPGAGAVLPLEAAPFFRLDLIEISGDPAMLPSGFGVVVVIDGSITLHTGEQRIIAPSGTTLVVPAAAGALPLSGLGRALLARSPAPPALDDR